MIIFRCDVCKKEVGKGGLEQLDEGSYYRINCVEDICYNCDEIIRDAISDFQDEMSSNRQKWIDGAVEGIRNDKKERIK